MPVPSWSISRRGSSWLAASVAFFMLTFSYVEFWIEPTLIYHYRRSVTYFGPFLHGFEFFKDFLGYPGGVTEYAAAFLSQFYFWSFGGAVVITAVSVCLCAGTHVVLRALGYRGWPILSFVSPAIFLLNYRLYDHHLAMALGVASALVFAAAYAYAPVRRFSARLVVFVALALCHHYAAGGTVAVFVLLCAFVAVSRGRYLLGAACLALGAAIPYCGTLVLPVRLAGAYMRLTPLQEEMRQTFPSWALLLYPVAVGAVACALQSLRRKRSQPDTERTAQPVPNGHFPANLLRSPATLVVIVVVVYCSLDRGVKTLLRIDYCAQSSQWEEVLANVRRLPPEFCNSTVLWNVNRALFHTGRLPSRMFSYPQGPVATLLTPTTAVMYVAERGSSPGIEILLSDIYLELGRVNEAEHLASEALSFIGERPSVLTRLALTKIAKREPNAARVFLRALRRDLIYEPVAEYYLKKLALDPLMAGEPQVKKLRALMVPQDVDVRQYHHAPTVEDILLQSLRVNKHNRMAFEYLMAHYLLRDEIEKFAAQAHRLDDFGYPYIPRHYEEALLVCVAQKGETVDLGRYRLRSQTLRDFEGFSRLLANHGGNRDAAQEELAGLYGDTFFYYHLYGPAFVYTSGSKDYGAKR